MRDEKGVYEKILAVPVAAPRFDDIYDISDVQKHWLVEIENFFDTYRLLEKKESYVEGWKGADEENVVLGKYGLRQSG